MAYLGVLGADPGNLLLVWARYGIPYVLLPPLLGAYAAHGGYVYVG